MKVLWKQYQRVANGRTLRNGTAEAMLTHGKNYKKIRKVEFELLMSYCHISDITPAKNIQKLLKIYAYTRECGQ